MEFYVGLSRVLGLDSEPGKLTFVQISLRGIIVFLATLVMVRVADKRFLARLSALDAILGFILASMLARAVNGSAAFFPTIGAGFVLVYLHRLLATLSCHSALLDRWTKGKENLLVKQGRIQWRTMRAHHISEKDLLEEVRLNGKVHSLDEVETATLERDGEISVIPAKGKQ